ncbi:synaptotagmin-like protein 2 isoform X5 [Latimeria chalumnae]|uniref:synaptotagmin-like protein 2 isoform X5 n=1 Tax=Latimeria chalumnae TaxID=7897 RepID=UPI0003C13CCE|nr:PREDICTED: synaptotagmin-like protein 2 isoform X5 [Latimeria chalumnae]|eukprot:XP_005995221.1 PREDICTED: synaptotagmin-like protein 2 isoform X5 [Latimeria chalumnae]
MIDLSFLTEEEQEKIMNVLKRDAELKKAEDVRIRQLHENVKDENQLKNMTGEWFYEAKSKRHRDKIHGTDIIRASMKKQKPMTIYQITQNRLAKEKNNWVNSINKEVFIPAELSGVLEESDEEQPEPSTTAKQNKAALEQPQENLRQTYMSPAKQRQNPFNDSSVLGDNITFGPKSDLSMNGTVPTQSTTKGERLPSTKNKLSNVSLPQIESKQRKQIPSEVNAQSQRLHEQVPVPKPRTIVHKPQDTLSVNSTPPKSVNRTDLNGNSSTRRGILKRNSSSSSNDSEVIRHNNNQDSQIRSALSPQTIQEGMTKKKPGEEAEEFSQNSLDRLKHVRFSATVHEEELPQTPESDGSKEIGEYNLLDSDYNRNDIEYANRLDGLQKYRRENRGSLKINTLLDTNPSMFGPNTRDVDILHTEKDETLSSLSNNSQSFPRTTEYTPQTQTIHTDLEISRPSSNRFTENLYEVDPGEVLARKETLKIVNPETKTSQFNIDHQNLHRENESPQVSKLASADLSQGSEEDYSPVANALRRSPARPVPSKSLEDIPSITSRERDVDIPKEDLVLSAEDEHSTDHQQLPQENLSGFSTVPSTLDYQITDPAKLKRLSKSVPAFHQEESDERETDSTSENSFQLGRHKKTTSSLTNLSSSSGMASLSSVSGSVMSIYSGDFGNVDVRGNIQFAIDYVEQLKEFHIFVAQCKDLAAVEVKKQRSDPYVKSYLFPDKSKMGKRKTSVKKKTLNPTYNEILRYKIDKQTLQTQKLNLSVWHNDTFGRNSFLGEVELEMANWDWRNQTMNWYPLKPRTSSFSQALENRGEMKLAVRYVPQPSQGKRNPITGEVHIWVKECRNLPLLRSSNIDPFVKCSVLPDTSRKSRQKTRVLKKTVNPEFNHTMVYDGFRSDDLREACVELTVWDHERLINHFLGGLRLGLGTGKSYGTPVDWMDSTTDEASLWEKMITSPNEWTEDVLPLRMLMVAKVSK